MNEVTDRIVFLADDDEINNFLSRAVLEEFLPEDRIFDFTSPGLVLQAARETCKEKKDRKFIFFIDINMPEFNGWELILRLKDLPGFDFCGKDAIYILSSSINPADRAAAMQEEGITGFLEKPLTMNVVGELLK